MNINIFEMPLDLGASRHGSDMGPSAIRLAGLKEKLTELKNEGETTGTIFSEAMLDKMNKVVESGTYIRNVSENVKEQIKKDEGLIGYIYDDAEKAKVKTQIKTIENDGYEAIQLGFDTKREKLATKASLGHTNKANTTPKRFLREIRGVNVNDYTLGQTLGVDIFEAGEMVDVTGTSKGKGFQGVIKRHNQTIGPKGHGSQYHRGVGSLGTLLPMHVLKGKKLPGHMGHKLVTVQNLEIVEIDLDKNIILVKGNVPGPKKSLVIIKSWISSYPPLLYGNSC